MAESRQVEQKAITDIKPYEFNNRRHEEEQIERIARSIREFGFNQPIVVDENGVILVGHGRLFAAQKLGLSTVPVVTIADLNDEQKRAYRILDNKLQNDSTWNFNNLDLELGWLEDQGFDLKEWGLDGLSINPTILDAVGLGAEERDTDYSRTFTLTKEQAEVVDRAIRGATQALPDGEKGNRAGAALAEIAIFWIRADER